MMAKRTPIKAIRAKCLDCTNGQNIEIRLCSITDCPLWEYRMGRRPKKDSEGFFEADETEGEEIIKEDFTEG